MTPSSLTAATEHETAHTALALFLAGAAGLGVWEAFAAVPTAWVAGMPLQPPELVKALVGNLLGRELSTTTAQLVHFVTGLVLYPAIYFAGTRYARSFGMPADGFVFGVVIYLLAYAVFVPLAGMRVLMLDMPALSLMGLVGHVAYGVSTAYVFEALDRHAPGQRK
jgi:hypothetical protein